MYLCDYTFTKRSEAICPISGSRTARPSSARSRAKPSSDDEIIRHPTLNATMSCPGHCDSRRKRRLIFMCLDIDFGVSALSGLDSHSSKHGFRQYASLPATFRDPFILQALTPGRAMCCRSVMLGLCSYLFGCRSAQPQILSSAPRWRLGSFHCVLRGTFCNKPYTLSSPQRLHPFISLDVRAGGVA